MPHRSPWMLCALTILTFGTARHLVAPPSALRRGQRQSRSCPGVQKAKRALRATQHLQSTFEDPLVRNPRTNFQVTQYIFWSTISRPEVWGTQHLPSGWCYGLETGSKSSTSFSIAGTSRAEHRMRDSCIKKPLKFPRVERHQSNFSLILPRTSCKKDPRFAANAM